MKIYIIEGQDKFGFTTLLVTSKFDETRFTNLIRDYTKYYKYVVLSCYENEEEIYFASFREGEDISFNECIYPKDMIDSSCGIDV